MASTRIVSNSIKTSNDNPLKVYPGQDAPKSAQNTHYHFATHNNLFGPEGRNNFESKSETTFGKTRVAKLGETQQNPDAQRKYRQELDAQNAYNEQVRASERRKEQDAVYSGQNGAPYEGQQFRKRDVHQNDSSPGNSLANPNGGSKATLKYEPLHQQQHQPKEIPMDFAQSEKQKRLRRKKQQENEPSFFDNFGQNRAPAKPYLSQTDVTKEKLNRLEQIKVDPDYNEELSRQVAAVKQQRMYEKMQGLQAEEEHTKTFSSYWQREGGGAPTTNPRRKNFNTLESPRRGGPEADQYEQQYYNSNGYSQNGYPSPRR